MRILRIETREGRGPYVGLDAPASSVFMNGNLWYKQPTPYEDGIVSWNAGHHFGFKNDDQLLAWFDPSDEDGYEQLVRMAEKGFAIVEYDCHGEIIEGYHQVAFERAFSTKVSELPLSQLVS